MCLGFAFADGTNDVCPVPLLFLRELDRRPFSEGAVNEVESYPAEFSTHVRWMTQDGLRRRIWPSRASRPQLPR